MSEAKFKNGDYVRVYCGRHEGHHFYIKDTRLNGAGEHEYLYNGMLISEWYREGSIVPAGSRKGWHYDSQGYCDNPGRGY